MEFQQNDPRECYPEIVQQAELLAKDFISYRLGKNTKPVNSTADTLRKLADKIEEQYPTLLNHLCHKLNLSRTTAYTTFVEIAGELFADGINWGRIVVLYAFGGRLAMYCEQHNMKDLVELVTDWVGKYIAGLSEWIDSEGGWDGLDVQFRDKTNDTSWWKGVFFTTLGIGTLAALVYTR